MLPCIPPVGENVYDASAIEMFILHASDIKYISDE